MNITERHIIYLLERYGFAAVPGLGVFIETRCPATVEGDIIKAPRREISFEPDNVTPTDSTLLRSIMRATGETHEAAELRIADDVSKIKQDIAYKGSATIGTIGQLTTEADGVLCFSANSRMPGEWFEDIILQPLKTEKPQVDTSDTMPDVRKDVFLRSLRRTASSAAAIACLAFITFIASQLPHRQSEPRTAATMVLTDNLPTRPISAETDTDRPPLMLIFNTPGDGTAPVEPVKASSTEHDGKYCLVIASLANRSDAEKFVEGREGLHILEKDDRFRIYTLTGETFGSLHALAQSTGAYDRYPTAWICRR